MNFCGSIFAAVPQWTRLTEREIALRKMILAAAILAASVIGFSATSAQACRYFSPHGANGTTNIRSGPSLSYGVQDEVFSTNRPSLYYCGDWAVDQRGYLDDYGRPFFWLHVIYTIDNRDGETSGWVASAVVDFPWR